MPSMTLLASGSNNVSSDWITVGVGISDPHEALVSNDKQLADYPIFFQLDGINYVQSLSKHGEYKKWQQ